MNSFVRSALCDEGFLLKKSRWGLKHPQRLVFYTIVRPVEMMSPDLRVLSGVDGLPPLPDTEYLLCYDPSSNNELAQVIYQAMESYHNPWQYSPMSAPEGDDSLLIERDIE